MTKAMLRRSLKAINQILKRNGKCKGDFCKGVEGACAECFLSKLEINCTGDKIKGWGYVGFCRHHKNDEIVYQLVAELKLAIKDCLKEN